MDMKKLHLVSLGCDKNLVDAENMLGHLYKSGFVFTDDPYEADIIVVNTCCFIRDAKDESIETILEMAEVKKEGRSELLIVTGCMAERYKDEIMESIPEVDAVLGTNAWQDISEIASRLMKGEESIVSMKPLSETHFDEQRAAGRVVTTGGHYAYLKISEGCNKRCTYCIIPFLRGNQRSVPMEELIEEAKRLAADGVKELILVAQETSVYGTDLYGKKMLPELLEKLNDIEGIEWIKIMYCYPEEVTDELIQAIKRLPKVCHYLDIPIQHASDHILKRMARKTTRAEITERINAIRKEIPDIVFRTTMISGFPGETDADHKILMEFIREMEFDRLGDFTYSKEEGTKAATFSHQISKKVKEERREDVMLLQQEIAFRKAKSQIGRRLRTIIEGRLTDTDEDGNVYVGRTYMDVPGVDGYIYINTGNREFMTGDMVDAEVIDANEYDLIGRLV
ncbi:MAG: 30S ribosomal protein S12 methylthiotransferase RimO [Eubacteriales bacterium]|nr:30S ribosomal protein S12 methylthiotransferase RimO [Eubacteriales bacterium]